MELNAEQIVKALEHCIKDDNCEQCPYSPFNCHIQEDALSLIKQLTEENERLEQHRKILEAKNERLEIICNSYALQYGTVADKEVFLKEERAGTVRKMQSEINKTLSALCKGDVSEIHRMVDQIAKEMVEGDNE